MCDNKIILKRSKKLNFSQGSSKLNYKIGDIKKIVLILRIKKKKKKNFNVVVI